MNRKSLALQAVACLLACQAFSMITRPVPADLFDGARRGQLARVRVCILAGVDLNTREFRSGTTALQEATMRGNTRVVAMLVRSGANPNIADSNGRTPLHEAASRCYYQMARILVLVGANVNARSTAGESPLTLAGRAHCQEVADLLRKMGAKD